MRVGIISVFTDYHRRGRHHRGVLQPQIGPLVAALLPPEVEIDVVNDTWEDPDWSRDYDLVFLSALHSDFDRARQLSHYYRRRGARTVLGGPLASAFPQLCAPWFDAIAVGDPETTVPAIHRDFAAGKLAPLYRAERYRPQSVPVPRLDLVSAKQVLPLALEATRGCPFTCGFCTLTGLGTRYHTRAAETIAAHVRAAQALIAGRVPRWKERLAVFYDNNIGGSPAFLRDLCDALAPLRIRWGGCITFNVLRDAGDARPARRQRLPARVLRARDVQPGGARRHGQAPEPPRRDPERDRRLPHPRHPRHRRTDAEPDDGHTGVHRPHSRVPRRVRAARPDLHLLRDAVSGHAALQAPRRAARGNAAPERAPARSEWLHARDATAAREPRGVRGGLPAHPPRGLLGRQRLRKLADDLVRFLPRGFIVPAAFDLFEMFAVERPRPADRTYIGGTEKAPPEAVQVPFAADDFASDAERAAICEPWALTDGAGRVLPAWLGAQTVYLPKGRIAPQRVSESADIPAERPITAAAAAAIASVHTRRPAPLAALPALQPG